MTMPRRQLVDVAVTRYYHCISRCVRRAFLCGEGVTHRKAWIEARLEVLAKHFAISVCGFAILDNHLHVLCRLDPGIADGWSDEDVVRRWIAVYRPSCLDVDNPATVQAWIDHQCRDTARVACYRARLQDLGWFMKALKQRVDHVRGKDDPETLQAAAAAKSIPAALIEADLEQSHWLCPLQDRTTAGTVCAGAAREGMLPRFSLSSYLELVDWTARLCRTGKARITQEVASIMTRLGTSPECWQSHLQKLLGTTRWPGTYCATTAARLTAIAAKHGVHHVDNALGGLAAE